MSIIRKSFVLALGLSLCTVSGYLLYILYKKEDDNDDDNNYYRFSTSSDNKTSSSSNYRVLKVPIPKEMVSLLIGRQGKNIKQVQEQSGTRINFDKEQLSSDCDQVMCSIRGSYESCNVADDLIRQFLNEQSLLQTVNISVPVTAVGRLIGRSGDQIREICTSSGAKVTVDRLPPANAPTSTTRRVTIRGTPEQVVVAQSLIHNLLLLEQHQQIVVKREPRLPPPKAFNKDQFNGNIITAAAVPTSERFTSDTAQQQFEVYISAMVDPSHFWLQIVGPKAAELDVLVDEMTEYYRKQDNRDAHMLLDRCVQKGDLVAAVFQYDSKWYRAEVLNVRTDDRTMAELYYVDYGDTDLVPCDELYELRTDFLRLHFQAIECYLAHVDPIGDDWSEGAIDVFEELSHVAQWKKLSAKINGYSVREKTRAKREGSPVPGVDLFDVNNEQDVDIARELVNRGLAVYKKNTGDLLIDNHNSRTTSSSISVASSSS